MPAILKNIMRVKSYPQCTLIVTLIKVTPMNRRIEAYYEGMRVKMRSTFIGREHGWMFDGTKKEI